MKFNFEIDNIKCAGCVSNIKTHLQNDERISNVEVEIATGCVTIESDIDASNEWLTVMAELGYPKK